MPDKLPKGWVKTTLGELAEPSRTRVLPIEVPAMPYVGLEHIESQSMKLLGHGDARETRSSSLRFSNGDVLYGKMRPYLNKVWVAEFDGICSAEFLVFSKRDGLNSQFLAVRLNAEDFVSFAHGQVSGERPRVDFRKLARFPIFLPPTAEQNRIVAKLNAALSGVRRAETAARRAQERLHRYRTAVLHAAVTGELTRDWRETQQKSKRAHSETGEALLRHLLTVRRANWEDVELQRLSAAGTKPKDDRWKSRYAEPTQPNTTDLPQLPDTWAWASLEMVAEIGSGISVSQHRLVKNPVELPYLRVANVMRGYFDLREIKTIRLERDQVARYLLQANDILFNEGGDRDKLGRGWVWEGQIPKCVHQNHVFRARLIDPSILNPKLVSHWGNTFGQSFFITHGTQTTNLASINRGVLGKMPVPIAPIDEQTEIDSEVERRLSAADRLAAALDQQLSRAITTRHSLQTEAFAGRIVSQNAKDEPASILLDRIRANRQSESHERKGMRMSKSELSVERRPLLDVLREHKKPMTPEELFHAAGHSQESVDQFFAELRELTVPPTQIAEERKAGARVLLRVLR